MPREVISAKNGTVSLDGAAVKDVTDITVTDEVDGIEYATSSTAGKKFENAGHRKISGSFTILQHIAADILAALGQVKPLIITTDGANEAFNGNALIKSATPSIPVQGGDDIARTINWAEAEVC